MLQEKVQPFLEGLLKDLIEARKRWCRESVDDAEEMWLEYPDFIESLIPSIEDILELPRSGFELLSAMYGSKNVADKFYVYADQKELKMKINNYTMGGDPNPGVPKELIFTYSYNGALNTVVVKEGTDLVLTWPT